MVKSTEKIRRQDLMNRLSLFDNFVSLGFKGSKYLYWILLCLLGLSWKVKKGHEISHFWFFLLRNIFILKKPITSVLFSLFLTLNVFHIFSSAFIFDFEHGLVCLDRKIRPSAHIFLDPVIKQKNADHVIFRSVLISLFFPIFYPLFHCNHEIKLFGEWIFEIWGESGFQFLRKKEKFDKKSFVFSPDHTVFFWNLRKKKLLVLCLFFERQLLLFTFLKHFGR